MPKLENDFADPLAFAKSRKAEATRKSYAIALRAFAHHVNIPFEHLQDYLKNPKLNDITSFAKDRSAGTRKNYVSIVKSWLEYNDVDFTKKQLDEIRVTVKKEDKTQQEPLTVDIIRKMCDVSGLQARTLFMTLLSTGCRIEELLLTEMRDVDFEKGTVFIRGDITKTGNSRTVILSLEAMQILKIWVQERPGYMKSSADRGQFTRNQKFKGENKKRREIKREDLLLPYSYETARSLFTTAIRKVYHTEGRLRKEWGDLYDPDTGRGKMHIHSFRTTFRMELSKGARGEICEKLMGHEGYLQGAYKDIALDDLIREYRRAEEHVTVYPTDSLKKRLLEATAAEARNRSDIEQIREENKKLKDQLATMEEQKGALQKATRTLEKWYEEEGKRGDALMNRISLLEEQMREAYKLAYEVEAEETLRSNRYADPRDGPPAAPNKPQKNQRK